MVDSVFSDNLSATIIEHARTEDIDLISVITDWQNDSSVTILGQFAQQLVNFSPVPVLSIHPKDNFVL
jgi:nucleotide-binding universal stress UspA family protein